MEAMTISGTQTETHARVASIVARVRALAAAAGEECVENIDGYVEWSCEADAYGVFVGAGGASGVDIIGSGATKDEALNDAAATVSRWEIGQ